MSLAIRFVSYMSPPPICGVQGKIPNEEQSVARNISYLATTKAFVLKAPLTPRIQSA